MWRPHGRPSGMTQKDAWEYDSWVSRLVVSKHLTTHYTYVLHVPMYAVDHLCATMCIYARTSSPSRTEVTVPFPWAARSHSDSVFVTQSGGREGGGKWAHCRSRSRSGNGTADAAHSGRLRGARRELKGSTIGRSSLKLVPLHESCRAACGQSHGATPSSSSDHARANGTHAECSKVCAAHWSEQTMSSDHGLRFCVPG